MTPDVDSCDVGERVHTGPPAQDERCSLNDAERPEPGVEDHLRGNGGNRPEEESSMLRLQPDATYSA